MYVGVNHVQVRRRSHSTLEPESIPEIRNKVIKCHQDIEDSLTIATVAVLGLIGGAA